MPRVVISDTSPVRYLVLIGQVELEWKLFPSDRSRSDRTVGSVSTGP